ncbi:hypothetical protein BJ166DRAFT_536085 [Pestalotiopsis sp. NC0098]|nr:hypothetical protein BJ166DRAFT_536085 [Pestalotiopsis sp. NC0098]
MRACDVVIVFFCCCAVLLSPFKLGQCLRGSDPLPVWPKLAAHEPTPVACAVSIQTVPIRPPTDMHILQWPGNVSHRPQSFICFSKFCPIDNYWRHQNNCLESLIRRNKVFISSRIVFSYGSYGDEASARSSQ